VISTTRATPNPIGAMMLRLESFIHDIWLTARGLVREPRLVLAAVTLTALVVGGNTTIYAVVHGLLAKPAPGVTATGLVVPTRTRQGDVLGPELSYRTYLELAKQTQTVRPIMSYGFDQTVRLEPSVYAVRGLLVSSGYFETLGLAPSRGRFFSAREYEAADDLVAVVSDRLVHMSGSTPEHVIGRSVAVNGQSAVIVGVTPPGFQGATLGESADIWVPLEPYARLRPRTGQHDWAVLPVVPTGRLVPSVSREQAQAEFSLIAQRLQTDHPKELDGSTLELMAYSMLGTGSPIHQWAPRFLALFSVISGLTLMIACANVGNLILARSIRRRREIAVRLALGASRSRIFGLIVCEGLWLGAVSWLMAWACATLMTRGLTALIPPDQQGMVVRPDFSPDWVVTAYAMVLAMAAGFLFTLVPAIRAWRQDVLPALKAGTQQVVQGRSRVTTGLVLVQLTFSVLLLTSAGLAARSLGSIETRTLGFRSDDMLLVTVNTTGAAHTREENAVLLQRVRDSLQATSGVLGVSYAHAVPGVYWGADEVRSSPGQAPVRVDRTGVGPKFFEVMGTPLLPGGDLPPENGSGGTLRGGGQSRPRQHTLAFGVAGRTIALAEERKPGRGRRGGPQRPVRGLRRSDAPGFPVHAAHANGVGSGPDHVVCEGRRAHDGAGGRHRAGHSAALA
jgi:predicted permease